VHPARTVTPIGAWQRQHVVATTATYLTQAEAAFGRRFTEIPVLFDLTGRAAGMYRVRNDQRVIRYNPYIFAKAFAENLLTTVPHEVAHYVVDILRGERKVRPHGPEWRAIMSAFGADPARSHAYDLTGVPVRTQRRHPYRCACTTHHLTTRRHYQVLRGTMTYHCRRCGQALTAVGRTVG
jgi:SprT protein